MPIYNFHYFAAGGHTPGTVPQFAPAGLQIAGPVLPVQVEIPAALAAQLQQQNQAPPHPVPGFALIDTGASVSAVDDTVIRQLSVQPVGIAQVGTAGGPLPQAIYPARLVFPGTNIPSIDHGQLLGANLTGQIIPGHRGPLIVLLGRDILQHFVLVYTGSTGGFTIAF